MQIPHPERAALAAFLTLLGAGLWLGRAPLALPQASEVTVSAVAGGVHLLMGRGGNVAVLVGDEGVVVVDDQMAPTEQALLAAIDGLSKAPWRFVLNTHFHGDHTGNNASFGARAPILAHANVRARLADPQRAGGALKAPALPVVTYADGLELHLGGERVRVRHFPNAHTDGDSVVFFERANVVHMGDVFFHERFPFVDLDSGGSVIGVVSAVDQVLAQIDDETRLIPGHGGLATKRDLIAYRDMLAECLELVRAAARDGLTLEAMKAARVLAKHEKLAWPFVGEERFLETIARELGVK